jgi:hypothetical protein
VRVTRKLPLGAAIGGAMIAAGAFGYALFTPGSSGAQTTTTVTTKPAAGAPHSNEDPAHEKGESAQREADENSGKAFAGRGPGGHSPNEDPAHEKAESAAREAQENAGQGSTAP